MEMLMRTFKTFITEKVDKKDVISFDIPLLIRVLEYTREDLKSDVNLHKMVERLITIRNKGTLTMADYTFVTRLKEEYIREDGMAVAGPANVVGSGNIAGSGGAGGEPGVNMKKKKDVVLQGMYRRKAPK
jgi:hypothetical protein